MHRQYFPDKEDETGAAKALMRLQDTYQLDSEAFSRGKLPGNIGRCSDLCKNKKYFFITKSCAEIINQPML